MNFNECAAGVTRIENSVFFRIENIEFETEMKEKTKNEQRWNEISRRSGNVEARSMRFFYNTH